MVRKRQVPRLEQISCAYYCKLFQNIDQETLNICIKYFNDIISESTSRGLFFCPQIIATSEKFIRGENWKVYRIQMLFLPQAKHLYLHNFLESVELSVKESILEMIVKQCPFLETLELKSLHQNSLLVTILPSLTYLSKLILSGSDCHDDILDIIFKTCRCLQVLDISSCPITDKGLQNLIVCKPVGDKLKKINIWRTQITVSGAVTILATFSNLQKFHLPCWMLIAALQEMIAKGNKDKIPQLRSLNHSDCSHMPMEKEWIFYSLICPKIEKINFGLFSSLKREAVPFNALRYLHLKKLHLFLFDITTLCDHYEFIQSLRYCGKTLTDLSLHSYNIFLDIYALGQCCPLLENVSIDVQNIIFRSNSMETVTLQPFQNLITLYLRVNYVDNSAELIEAVEYLLTSCIRIKSLALSTLWPLTDDIFFNIWLLNSMIELENLDLESIPFITKRCIDYISRQENSLETIRLRNCGNIRR